MFAALAFTGSGYLFKMFDKSGYGAEMARHNAALEELAKAKEAFIENETIKHDRIIKLKGDIKDAEDDMQKVNDSLDLLAKVRTITFKNRRFSREPKLEDFYKPSNEMKSYQWLFSGIAGAATGFVLHLVI